MKVLAVLGSPRKGNTYKVLNQIEESMKKHDDDIEFEYIFLKDAELEMCRGCFLCVSKGEELCPIKDCRMAIHEKMAGADGVIFATPVYIFNVSALMKNMFDRMSYISHRPIFMEKHAMAVVTSCGGGIPETLKYLMVVLRSWGFSSIIKLGIMTHPAFKQSVKSVGKIEKAACEFYSNIKENKQVSPSLVQIIQFRMMKINAIESKQYFPADYEFYKDKIDYYIKTPINFFKNMLAKILEKVIIKSMDSAV